MRYDVIFISAAMVCLLIGESLGIWMGVNQDFLLSPAHAHLNLVGWATLALYGLIHRAYPTLAGAKLARTQLIVAVIGGFALPAGIAVAVTMHATLLAIVASILVLTGTVMFAIMFFGRAAKAA